MFPLRSREVKDIVVVNRLAGSDDRWFMERLISVRLVNRLKIGAGFSVRCVNWRPERWKVELWR